ncbi:hypothetical protein ACFXGT_11530 [Streptomyces sp. NPDC059352]
MRALRAWRRPVAAVTAHRMGCPHGDGHGIEP